MGGKPTKEEEPAAAETKPNFDPPARASRASKVGAVNHEAFIVDNPGKINKFYTFRKTEGGKDSLGEGSYGTVKKATSNETNAIRAVKEVAKADMKDVAKFKREISIMKKMDHPFILKLYETFEDNKNIYLVLELCAGGELFDAIINAGSFTEQQAAHLMMQTLSGVNYMHQMSICHRDIKPENFLFAEAITKQNPIEKATLKIIDFGLSCQFSPGEVLRTKAGTPYYVAPQVLEGQYDQACDLWSCGVIMFVVLCGYPPFYAESDREVLQKVQKAELVFDREDWKNISEDAKTLIRNLLKRNVKERWTAEQAMNHEWIKDRAPRATGSPISGKLVDNLRAFRVQNKLMKAALHVIASQLDDGQIKALRETFMTLDANGDGLLTHQELTEGLKKAGFKEIPPDLKQIMEEVDSDGSGVIDYTEFLAATLDKKVYMQENVCWAAFRVFDRNGDGKISKDELKLVLGEPGIGEAMHKTAEALDQIMAEADSNGDGQIDFKEFMAMMGRSGSSIAQ